MFFLAECDIPPIITGILSQLYKIIIILVPIGIVIFGSIDFIKATIAKDSNAIASSTKTFISRLISGCITFFVLTIVTWLFRGILKGIGEANSAMNCALQIIGGTASSSNSGNNYSSQMANKMMCFGSQYSSCISQNQSPNRVEECTNAANSICGTSQNIPTTTPTTTTTTTTNNKPINIIDSCKNKCDQQESIGGLVGTAASIISKNECKKACETDNQNIINAINACKNNCPEKEYHWTNSGNMNIPTISNANEIKACEQKCETTDYNNYLSSTHESSTGQTHGGGGGKF